MRKYILLMLILIVAFTNINAQFKATYLGYITEEGQDFYVADVCI